MATLPIVNKEDKKYGIITSLATLTAILIVLFIITFQMADPPPHVIPVEANMQIDEMLLENLKVETSSSAGGGQPSDDEKVDEPVPQTEKIITTKSNPNHKVNSGEASSTTSPNSTNQASTTQQSNDPFAKGGSNDGPNNGPFNKEDGLDVTSKGEESGGGGARIRTVDPNIDNVQCDEHETIHFKVAINEEGRVISAINVTSVTTTTDQRLINMVKAEVIRQTRYVKKPGRALEYAYITVKTKPQ
jgi:hypothetical protein